MNIIDATLCNVVFDEDEFVYITQLLNMEHLYTYSNGSLTRRHGNKEDRLLEGFAGIKLLTELQDINDFIDRISYTGKSDRMELIEKDGVFYIWYIHTTTNELSPMYEAIYRVLHHKLKSNEYEYLSIIPGIVLHTEEDKVAITTHTQSYDNPLIITSNSIKDNKAYRVTGGTECPITA